MSRFLSLGTRHSHRCNDTDYSGVVASFITKEHFNWGLVELLENEGDGIFVCAGNYVTNYTEV